MVRGVGVWRKIKKKFIYFYFIRNRLAFFSGKVYSVSLYDKTNEFLILKKYCHFREIVFPRKLIKYNGFLTEWTLSIMFLCMTFNYIKKLCKGLKVLYLVKF